MRLKSRVLNEIAPVVGAAAKAIGPAAAGKEGPKPTMTAPSKPAMTPAGGRPAAEKTPTEPEAKPGTSNELMMKAESLRQAPCPQCRFAAELEAKLRDI